MDYLNENTRNIITIEDPVEIQMSGITQMQVNSKAGLNYSLGLRAMLRQDPDVIMIGEIRDSEVAQAALRAALTGHLVLTTLHTKNALGVISRLINMGIEPTLLALALQGATAQRLIRKICPHCREEADIETYRRDPRYTPLLEAYQGPCFKGRGCEHCHHTGYLRRIPLYEVLTVDKVLENNLLHARLETIENSQPADFSSMLKDGQQKISQGLTTFEEVWRVLNGIDFS